MFSPWSDAATCWWMSSAAQRRRSTTASCWRCSTEGVDVVRHGQGSRRQDARRAVEAAGRARRLSAQDHPRRDRQPTSPSSQTPQLYRGDIVTLVGRDSGRCRRHATAVGRADRATDVDRRRLHGAGIAIGALIGAFVGGSAACRSHLSTSGGALIAGLFFGWLRSVRPTFRTHTVSGSVVHELRSA